VPASVTFKRELPTVGFGFSAIATSVATTLVAIAAGVLVHAIPLMVDGRPRPWLTPEALALSVGLNASVTHALLPFIAGHLGEAKPPDVIRQSAWAKSRWALLGGGVGVATLGVGAGLEESSFGRGQAVMITGILVCLVSMVAWDVLEASGAWEAVR